MNTTRYMPMQVGSLLGAISHFWESRLLDIAIGGSGNAQAIQWALRNRSRAAAGWHSDGHPPEPEVQVPYTPKIDPSRLTWEEQDILRKAMVRESGMAEEYDQSGYDAPRPRPVTYSRSKD